MDRQTNRSHGTLPPLPPPNPFPWSEGRQHAGGSAVQEFAAFYLCYVNLR